MKGVFENRELSITAKFIKGFWGFPPMFHAHVEAVFVRSGAIQMIVDGKAYTLSAGEMSVCFPYLIHSYEESPDTEAVLLMFSPGVVEPFSSVLWQVKPENPYFRITAEFEFLLNRILIHKEADTPQAEALARVYLSALVGELLRNLKIVPVDTVNTEVLRNLLVYCEKHCLENISIASVAHGLHISESYVSKLFSAGLGCSFRSYINRVRLTEAIKLLRSTNRTILDIMLTCGYNNQSSFNRVFSQELGMTPRECRKMWNPLKK